ncbi:glutamate--tRNA ligase [Candidatus Woesearchaeota archaeon]|nr:glutamate--tRNA ligase [Candidatus Woesearchaeota archaeon]
MKETTLKYVLKNAYDFNGSINDKVVLGMVLKEKPELKAKVPEVLKGIQAAGKEISKLSKEELKKKLAQLALELLQETKEEKVEGPLKPLPDAEMGKVVVRIAPSPSGPLHIGHAYGTALNYEYAQMYQGKFLLRIEDTNPENIYPQAYELIQDDVNWLTENGIAKVVVQSSRLGIYYDSAEKLVQMGKAYACTCNGDAWIEMKNQGKACPCRSLSAKENLSRYAKLFGEYAEGEAVLRLKTDIQNKNPAMRDFGIMRIVEHIHPKTGKTQRVWPLMIFSVAVDDHELGVTHVLNGKDHADNAKKEQIIMGYLGWKSPSYQHWGRINFEGFELSTSKTRRAIEEGKYTGWEDIRLPFLRGLRKRGYQPGAFRKFALGIGLTLNDKTVSIEEFWKSINAFNRDIIEPDANRYFFVDSPAKIKIEKAPAKVAEIELHPNYPQRGKRKISATGEVYLCKTDIEKLEEGKLHRLMDYCNFEVKKGKYHFVSEGYEEYKNSLKKGAILHWVPVKENLAAEVLMDDAKVITGYGEKNMEKLKAGDIVQLERKFYARVDEKSKDKIKFWYLHK